jgi:hypothetical protein
MGAFGFFGQPREEREAAIEHLEDEERNKIALANALDKVRCEFRRTRGQRADVVSEIKFTRSEIVALHHFGMKFYND